MKIAVAGKGGAGKTTLSGTVARALARAGHDVLAVDADSNPMLGISLGVGPDETERLLGVRQAIDAGEIEHQGSIDDLVRHCGADAPDGVRIVMVSRIDDTKPGCPCCGMSPEQLMAELEEGGRIVICDLEAGVSAVVRAGEADLVVIVAEPTAKSVEVARRGVEIASENGARALVVANRVRDEADAEYIRDALGADEVLVVPEEPEIARADRDGAAPIDVAPDAPGVQVLRTLAERLAPEPVPA